MADSLEYILECQICLEDFEDAGEHVPRLLPCSHTFCEKCLKNIIKRIRGRKVATCPECRKQQPAGNDVQTFPQNKYILVNVKRKQQDEPATEKCEEHGKELSLYCKRAGCEKPICLKCLTKYHREHDVIDMEEEAKEAFLIKVKSLVSSLEIKQKKIEALKEDLHSVKLEYSRELQRSQKEIISQIKERFDTLHGMFNDQVKRTNSALEDDKKSIQHHLEILDGIENNIMDSATLQKELALGEETIKSITENMEANLPLTKNYECLKYIPGPRNNREREIQQLCGLLKKEVLKGRIFRFFHFEGSNYMIHIVKSTIFENGGFNNGFFF